MSASRAAEALCAHQALSFDQQRLTTSLCCCYDLAGYGIDSSGVAKAALDDGSPYPPSANNHMQAGVVFRWIARRANTAPFR